MKISMNTPPAPTNMLAGDGYSRGQTLEAIAGSIRNDRHTAMHNMMRTDHSGQSRHVFVCGPLTVLCWPLTFHTTSPQNAYAR